MDWGFSGKSYGLGIFRFVTFRSERNRGVTVNSWVVENWEYVQQLDCSGSAVKYVSGVCVSARLVFLGSSVLARGASHGIWNPFFPLPWGARGAILAAALHALTAGA